LRNASYAEGRFIFRLVLGSYVFIIAVSTLIYECNFLTAGGKQISFRNKPALLMLAVNPIFQQ